MQILWYSPSCQRRRPPQAREQFCQRIRRHPQEVQILLGLPLRVQAVMIGRGVDAALITAGRRWPLGPVGMDAAWPANACFYFLRAATAATAALQSSLRLERAFLMQATFWIRRRSVPHCCCTSVRHVFPAAATSANLALHTSERSVTCSLRQVAMRRFPGLMLAQVFYILRAGT